MSTYRIHYQETLYSYQDVEAESDAQARDKFMQNDYESNAEMVMSDFEGILDVEEICS